MGKGNKKSNQPVKQEISQVNLPEYARPYYENLLQGAQGYLNRALDPNTPYPAYEKERIAGFTDQQKALQAQIAGMQTPSQFGTATDLTTAAGLQALNSGNYDPGYFRADRVRSERIGAPSLQQYQMQGPADVQSRDVQAQQVSAQNYNSPLMQAAQSNYRPDLQQYQMQGPADVQAARLQQYQMQGPADVQAQQIQAREYTSPEMRAAQTNWQANLQQYQMEGPERFGAQQAYEYMSPFQQNVTDIQKREAIRDAKQGQLAQDLGAARQGTYGGSRQLLASMERERNLGQQLGDIQGRGSQAAYENAQAQFERDRAAGLTTGQANLQAKLGVQQLGTQSGLQAALANLDAESQSRVQNLAAQLQTQGLNAQQAMQAAMANQQASLQASLANQQAGLTVGQQNLAAQLQTQGLSAEQAMQAALANQQAGLTVGQQNLGAQLRTQELGAQQSMQMALANLDADSQSRVQNLAAQLQTQGLNADQAMKAALANQQASLQADQSNQQSGLQAALANQQAGLTVGQQNLAAQLQTQGLSAEQAMKAAMSNQQSGLQAALANQQYGLEAQRLREQSRQFGAQQRLAGAQAAGQMGQTLSNIGSAQLQGDISRFGLQQQTAAQQQALDQQKMDQAYQDFLRQRDYPLEVMQQYSSLLRGVPVGLNSAQTTYAQQPSLASQLLGTGLGAAGIYNTFRGP